jgi:hypothetical protein
MARTHLGVALLLSLGACGGLGGEVEAGALPDGAKDARPSDGPRGEGVGAEGDGADVSDGGLSCSWKGPDGGTIVCPVGKTNCPPPYGCGVCACLDHLAGMHYDPPMQFCNLCAPCPNEAGPEAD